jgi:hypothetical protein
MRGIKSRLGLTVALGLTAIGLTVAPADAAIGPVTGAKLTVKSLGPIAVSCEVSVDGLVTMTQAEAQALIDSGHRVVVRVWGEDPIDDDLMLGPYYLTQILPRASGYIAATPQGLRFHKDTAVKGAQLNEDAGALGGTGDELYAGVRLVNAAGTTIRSGETNRVGGHNFGCSYGTWRYY